MTAEVLIAGGGLAGLCCGLRLAERGVTFRIFEAASSPGGRMRTAERDGFLLDRGFQVLLTAYPEAEALLDYGELDLKPFYPGALVWSGGRFHRVADPWRRPFDAAAAPFSPVGSLTDKLRVGSLRDSVLSGTLAELMNRPEVSTIDRLLEWGFSESMIDLFFRPFLGGVFFDRELLTSSRMFEFVFRMFAQGDTAVPAGGMARIPLQLAARLPEGSLEPNARVASVTPRSVVLEDGRKFEGARVVIATEAPEAARLLGVDPPASWRSVTGLYFAAAKSPVNEGILVLNGEADGPVNHLAVMSDVAPGYAPAGHALISATVLGNPPLPDGELAALCVEQLAGWYGDAVWQWRLLQVDRIGFALPDQFAPALDPPERPVRMHNGLFLCGDHLATASIQGAMVSGRRAADAVLAELR